VWILPRKVSADVNRVRKVVTRHRDSGTNDMLGVSKIQFVSRSVKAKAVPLHAMEALGWTGIAPTHS
jgi:ribose 1,5-bisphosphokinase PhnN